MSTLDVSTSIIHFSHEHPLHLQNLPGPVTGKTTCLACSGNVSGSLFYTCGSCNFYLHKTCADLPRTLKHLSDQSHDLVLLSSPAYPQGLYKCNACGLHGSGFSYHCPECQLDLHVVCASMPQSIYHKAHTHTLGLCLKPPYETHGSFKCDICNQPGSNQWLYRCDSCEFDVHMKCATTRTTSRAIPPLRLPPPPIQSNDSRNIAPTMGVHRYVPSMRPSAFVNNMTGHIVEGFVGSVTQEIMQYVLEGMDPSNN